MQRWSKLTFGEVRPIPSIEMFDSHLAWVAEEKRSCTTMDVIWARTRNHIASLALFHGYLPDSFKWSDSLLARSDLQYQVADRHAVVNRDPNGKTVKVHKSILTQPQLIKVHKFAYSMEAASLAILAAFIGITNQTLARPGQICSLNRCHLTMNPDAELPVLPAFGPVMMLQLGDRGNHKVADKGTDMTHFVMRTLHPSLVCPWFALALNAGLQATVQGRSRYDDICSGVTGQWVCFAVSGMPVYHT